MGTTRTVARNVLWNWAGTATNMVAGLIVAPFLVNRLGEAGYGLWILIASLTGYFDLLDLGIRGSLGRHMAFQRARSNPAGVQAVFSTGLAILSCGAVLVITGTVLVVPLFFVLFDVPPEQAGEVRLAILLIGLNLALIFPLSVFDATLWAYQRFDRLNVIDIPAVLVRVVLTVVLIGRGHGLVTLAVITLGLTLATGLAKGVSALLLDRGLRLSVRHAGRAEARELFGFGIWCVLLAATRILSAQFGQLIIGSLRSVALVTPFTIAARLVGYVQTVLLTSTGVLTPLTTALHAEDRQDSQQRLFVEGGKWCLALALFFVGLFGLLGGTLISLWMRRELDHAPHMLLVLSLGELLPLSQSVTASIILGIGRHRLSALMALVELGASLSLSILLIEPFGPLGVCLAIAVPATLCRGVVQLVYGCRILDVPLAHYLGRGLVPAAAAAVPPVAVLAVLTGLRTPEGWFEFLGYVTVYGLCFVATGALVLLGPERVRHYAVQLLPPVRGEERAVCECQER